jgi:hypothetical protein
VAENLFEHVERIPRKREPPQRPVRHVTGTSYTSGPSAATIVKGIAIAVVVVALFTGIWVVLGAFDSDHTNPAPWSSPAAPDVKPHSLSAQ